MWAVLRVGVSFGHIVVKRFGMIRQWSTSAVIVVRSQSERWSSGNSVGSGAERVSSGPQNGERVSCADLRHMQSYGKLLKTMSNNA